MSFAIGKNKNILTSALNAPPESASFVFKSTWEILSKTGKILSSTGPLRESLEQKFPSIPDMFFAENILDLKYRLSEGDDAPSVGIRFTAEEALNLVKRCPPADIKVGAAESWNKSRKEQISELTKSNCLVSHPHNDFDWTFNTNYNGTLYTTGQAKFELQETNDDLDWANLQRRDVPILFSASIPLYEDELEDFGCAQTLCRIRVMPDGFFLLSRYFLRVDGVKFISNETRIRFVVPKDFNETNPPTSVSFLRICVQKEAQYDLVAKKVAMNGQSILDIDYVASILQNVNEHREKVIVNLSP